MGLRDIFSTIAVPTIFTTGGEDAVFIPAAGPSVPCKIFIDFDVLLQPAGIEVQVWQRGTQIEAALTSDVGIGISRQPVRGEQFVYDGITYTVDTIIANDGFTVKAVVT